MRVVSTVVQFASKLYSQGGVCKLFSLKLDPQSRIPSPCVTYAARNLKSWIPIHQQDAQARDPELEEAQQGVISRELWVELGDP